MRLARDESRERKLRHGQAREKVTYRNITINIMIDIPATRFSCYQQWRDVPGERRKKKKLRQEKPTKTVLRSSSQPLLSSNFQRHLTNTWHFWKSRKQKLSLLSTTRTVNAILDKVTLTSSNKSHDKTALTFLTPATQSTQPPPAPPQSGTSVTRHAAPPDLWCHTQEFLWSWWCCS